MQALQGMDPDKMVIIFPTALIAMYLMIRIQKSLCERSNPYVGLVLPAICFVVSTILAVRPLFVADAGEFDGLVMFCLRMWLTFNISTLVFLFPYYKHRKYVNAVAKAQLQEQSQEHEQEQKTNKEQEQKTEQHQDDPNPE